MNVFQKAIEKDVSNPAAPLFQNARLKSKSEHMFAMKCTSKRRHRRLSSYILAVMNSYRGHCANNARGPCRALSLAQGYP